MARIKIQVGNEVFDATLEEERAPQTVAKILAALPIKATAMTWGEEIYFDIPVSMDEENAVETVRKGDLAFWSVGSAFCIFFGRTPTTETEDEIKPASAVNPIGCIQNPDALKKHRDGEPVRVALAD